MLQKLKSNPLLWLWILFGLAALVATLRNLLLPSGEYTHYNNYIIFKQSFYHLIHGQNLYLEYPADQYDLFKYSPAFAFFFGIFAWMPDWLGLGLWNLLNAFVLVFAIKHLPLLSNNFKLLFGLLILQETVTATINSQSNVLIAGLLILAWISLEKDRWWAPAMFITLTVFIKLFGILFFVLFLFYPKWWRGIIPSISTMLVLFFFPVILLGWDKLLVQYESYIALLSNDHGTFVKYSVMGWLKNWFHYSPQKNMVLISGLTVQVIASALVLFKNCGTKTKGVLAGSWMIWMVIFNHMAESATFIIAVAGILLWFFYSEENKWLRLGLLVPVMAFTCFGPSDIYPPWLREKIVIEWQLKVFPCILVWMATLFYMFKDSISSLTSRQGEPL